MERVAAIETVQAVDKDQAHREKFVALVGNIRVELYNFAYRLTGTREEAEDLLQEAYFKAFKYFHQLRDENKFKEWIFQITANQFKNYLRRKKKENTVYQDDSEHDDHRDGDVAQEPGADGGVAGWHVVDRDAPGHEAGHTAGHV